MTKNKTFAIGFAVVVFLTGIAVYVFRVLVHPAIRLNESLVSWSGSVAKGKVIDRASNKMEWRVTIRCDNISPQNKKITFGLPIDVGYNKTAGLPWTGPIDYWKMEGSVEEQPKMVSVELRPKESKTFSFVFGNSSHRRFDFAVFRPSVDDNVSETMIQLVGDK